jgi:carbonic anhydrase
MAIGAYILLTLLVSVNCDGGHYSYESNGADWGETCATGQSQSPIDLIDPLLAEDGYGPIRIQYAPTRLFGVEDYDSTFKFAGSFGTLTAVNVDQTGNFTYSSAQCHFHAPSEHTLGSKSYPLELHIVHVLTSSSSPNPLRFAVLGVFFQEGAFNPALAQFQHQNATLFDLGALFEGAKEVKSYYMYKGSLTTPPCTEAVNWYVSNTVLSASKEQLNFFERRWPKNQQFAGGKGNNRILMPVNGRDLLLYNQAQASLGVLLGLMLSLLY